MAESTDPVDPVEAEQLVDADAAVLLDVRDNDEWEAGHAPRAARRHDAAGRRGRPPRRRARPPRP